MHKNITFFTVVAVHVLVILCIISYHNKYKPSVFTTLKNSKSTLISAIVPVHNSEKYLKPFLDSIFKQSITQIEYIFVNDQSSDRSVPLIEEYVHAHNVSQSVTILHNAQNMGPGPSRNAGIAAAKGEYVCFIDPDDWISPTYFEHMYAGSFAPDGARYDVVKGRMVMVKNKLRKFYKRAPFSSISVSGREPYVFEQFAWQHFTGLFKRDLLVKHKDARYGDSKIGEDIVFLAVVGYYAQNISFVKGAKYFYRVRNGSLSDAKSADFYKSDLKSMKKVVDFYALNAYNRSTKELFTATLKKLEKWNKKVDALYKKTMDNGYLTVLDGYYELKLYLKSLLNETINF